MRSSPLDNGDFDGDGQQDLIAGNFGTDSGSAAVLFGDGMGYFSYLVDTDIYTREGFKQRLAVTGPAFFEFNKAPVAQLTPESIEVTVGDTVEWDGSGSYDEDGTIVGYEWDYGDGAVQPMDVNTLSADGTGGPQSSYVFYDSGTYTVTMTVTDDKGATATVQAEVRVKPIKAVVRFSPRKLNLKSQGKWIKATIWVPGSDADMIDTGSLYLEDSAIKGHVSRRGRKDRKLTVKFDRQDLIAALGDATGPVALTVSGDISQLVSGQIAPLEFAGTGTIVTFGKQKRRDFQKDLWKEIMSWFSKGKSKHK